MNKFSGMLLRVVLFALFVALATVNGWGYDRTFTCSGGDSNCPVVGWITTCSSCEAAGWGSVSCIDYVVGQQVSVDGYYQCEVTEVIGACSSCRYTGTCGSNKRITVGCYESPSCRPSDTLWLNDSKAACDAIGGENNYAISLIDETCVHSGTCCPNDSIPSGNTCKWRCDSVLTTCNGRTGDLFGAVLPDTSISGGDTTFSYQCFYNCAYSPNPDSTVYLVEGNTVLSGPSDSIADGIKSEWFSSIRSTTGSIYVYDYLSPAASEYVDSIAAMKCVEHLWRCVINNKYVYWYDNQEVPAGCTNIVRVK